MNVAPISNNYNNYAQAQSFKSRNKDGTGGTGKALISTLVPGLGQLFDGRFGAGALFLGGSIGGWQLRKYLLKDSVKAAKEINTEFIDKAAEKLSNNGKFGEFYNEIKNGVKNDPKMKEIMNSPKYKIGRKLIWGIVALHLINMVDAYRGGFGKKD